MLSVFLIHMASLWACQLCRILDPPPWHSPSLSQLRRGELPTEQCMGQAFTYWRPTGSGSQSWWRLPTWSQNVDKQYVILGCIRVILCSFCVNLMKLFTQSTDISSTSSGLILSSSTTALLSEWRWSLYAHSLTSVAIKPKHYERCIMSRGHWLWNSSAQHYNCYCYCLQ